MNVSKGGPVNEHLRKALQKFFGEIVKHGEGAVPEAATDCFRLLGGNVADLELDKLPEEEVEEDPVADEKVDEKVEGDQD